MTFLTDSEAQNESVFEYVQDAIDESASLLQFSWHTIDNGGPATMRIVEWASREGFDVTIESADETQFCSIPMTKREELSEFIEFLTGEIHGH